MTVYLDTCCYNRLFDDRRIIKNFLERESVILILQLAVDGQLRIVGSRALDKEILNNKDLWKRDRVYAIYNSIYEERVDLTTDIVDRAKEFSSLVNTTPFDSLHLALSERNADFLITTDIRLERAAGRSDMLIRVYNPIQFIRDEVIDDDTDN